MSFNTERHVKFAHGLKTARQKAKLNAKDASSLIVAAGIRCTRGSLLAWERGGGATSREPFASDLPMIAKVYGCAVVDFFPGSNGQAANDGQQPVGSAAG